MSDELRQPASAPVKTARARKGKFDALDVFIFLIPFCQFVQIHMIGVLSGSDALLLLTFLYLGARLELRLANPKARRFLVLCGLWLFSQMVTDLIRHIAFTELARTWSSIFITFVAFACLFTLLYGNQRRIVVFGWGYVFGSLVAFFAAPSDFAKDYPWKFGVGFPCTLGVMLLASRRNCPSHVQLFLAVAIGVINVVAGARSLGELCLSAAFFIYISHRLRNRNPERARLGMMTKVGIAVGLVLGIAGMATAYEYVASRGILGDEAAGKLSAQSGGKYGVLLGGRTEMLGSIPAIYDSPVIGHGSGAKDPKYVFMEQETLAVLGYDEVAEGFDMAEEEGGAAIPTHSYFFSAWVWGGFLGALFWAWNWSLALRALLRFYPAALYILPLACYCAFELMWDILFSPYGTAARIAAPFYIVMMITCLDARQPKPARASRPARGLLPRMQDSGASA